MAFGIIVLAGDTTTRIIRVNGIAQSSATATASDQPPSLSPPHFRWFALPLRCGRKVLQRLQVGDQPLLLVHLGAASLAEPALDPDVVYLGLIFGFAPVEPMADQRVPMATVCTASRAGEDNPSEMCNVILDRTAKTLYDGHLFGKPDLRDVAAKLDSVDRAVPFLETERLAYPTFALPAQSHSSLRRTVRGLAAFAPPPEPEPGLEPDLASSCQNKKDVQNR